MKNLHCVSCGGRFTPIPQVPNQTYCSKINCQKERRQQWQRTKLKSDPDYRDNQSRAQKAWAAKNPDYWRQYRQGRLSDGNSIPFRHDTHIQKTANSSIKMDSINPTFILRRALQDGVFSLKVLSKIDEVKMDVWIIELSCIHEY